MGSGWVLDPARAEKLAVGLDFDGRCPRRALRRGRRLAPHAALASRGCLGRLWPVSSRQRIAVMAPSPILVAAHVDDRQNDPTDCGMGSRRFAGHPIMIAR
jgi:hypothetical protein